MANRLEVQTPQITINIADLVIGDTVIKRKATLFTMTYNQFTKTVSLSWTVKSYANNAGEYGDALTMIPDYSKESIADNTIFVNPATGEHLQKTEPIPDTDPVEYDYPMDYMGQYDFFYIMGATQEIRVHDVITQYGNQMTSWDK